MPLDKEVGAKLKELSDLDHEIELALTVDELSVEDIARLVDTREQILQSLLEAFQAHPELSRSQQWQDAVTRTQTVVAMMQEKTAEFGQALKKYRHGKRSVQQYQKFL
ncbi:flagellar protein FliT [Vibrio sp. JPW-9-11-11]|uniref:flagellar protein FliT n=1 Tax=Vibrio sp. JPW-9-11-11 TaxID=1416532 RepID=UPI001C3CCF1C|nr:flagellar protein FliT [Vibrio sp. JPW-9-11-11]NVD06126.1 flagellar protein FliT [Vibrio sp. JPW-9-11-11]